MADPDVVAIVADLNETGIHLGPGTQGWIEPGQLAEISAAAEQAGLPVHLVLVVPPERGDMYYGDDLLVRVHDAGGPDGLYIGVNRVWATGTEEDGPHQPFLPGGAELRVALQQWGDVAGSSDLTDDVERVLDYANGPGGPFPFGEGVLRVVEALGEGTFSDLVVVAGEGLDLRLEQSRQEREETGTSTSSGSGGDQGDGVGAGEIATVLLVLVAVGVAVTALIRRARGRSSRQTFVLPDSVLDRVRAAEDAELGRRARNDVLALGEAIDAAEMSGSSSGAWAAALDHYETASRLLPADEIRPGTRSGTRAGSSSETWDFLDAVGAVVLAGRGREALEAARRGKTFTPTTPCFLNPLHGRANRDQSLEHSGRSVRAPICAACRRDLETQRRPDILDVVVRGTPQHYFETDREPWASTGFGALDPDLLTRLHREVR